HIFDHALVTQQSRHKNDRDRQRRLRHGSVLFKIHARAADHHHLIAAYRANAAQDIAIIAVLENDATITVSQCKAIELLGNQPDPVYAFALTSKNKPKT